MTSYHHVDPVSGARLIGGEMLQWSDLGSLGVDDAPGLLMRAVFEQLRGPARVLLLGPRASRLVDRLPAAADVELDVLVRGLPDAREISALAQLHRGMTVLCGALDRFEPRAPYDLVVNLDAPELLMTPDSEGLGPAEVLRRTAKWLTPEGALVAVVANDLGIDSLLRLDIRDLHDSDQSWYRGAPGLSERPPYHRELSSVLDAAGLRADVVYAAFPSASAITLLVDRDAAEDPALAATGAALVSRTEGAHFSDHAALADAYGLALRIFDSGLAVPLAAGWLLVARPQSALADSAAEVSLPAIVAGEDVGRREWRAVTTMERRGEGWVTRLRPVQAAPEMRERRFVRDYSALGEVVSDAVTLEASLRRACTQGDVAQIRDMVRRYHAWLERSERQPGEGGDVRFFAVPANVVLAGNDLKVLDASWRLMQDLPVDALLVRGLRDFAVRMLASGVEHPWAPNISPDSLTQTLTAMVGDVDVPSLVDRVARVEAEFQTVVQGGSAADEALGYARNLERGASQFGAHGGPARGYREALAAAGRLAQELHDREGQVTWLEASLRSRDRVAADLDRQLEAVRGSISFKIGRVLTWPLRALLAGVRRTAMSAIPAGYLSRLRSVLSRFAPR